MIANAVAGVSNRSMPVLVLSLLPLVVLLFQVALVEVGCEVAVIWTVWLEHQL